MRYIWNGQNKKKIIIIYYSLHKLYNNLRLLFIFIAYNYNNCDIIYFIPSDIMIIHEVAHFLYKIVTIHIISTEFRIDNRGDNYILW